MPRWLAASLFQGGLGVVVGSVMSGFLQGRQARRAAEQAVRRQREEQTERRLRQLEDWRSEQTGEQRRRNRP